MALEFKTISIDEITTNGNVRSKLDIDTDFVSSIKAVGIIQPVTVARNGDGYVVVHGHRRVSAAKRAGLTEIPAMIRDEVPEDSDRLTTQLVENLQRTDLTPADEAQGVLALTEHITQKEVAVAIGRSETWVSQRRRLATAPKVVRDWLDKDEITLEAALTSTVLPQAHRSRIAKAVEEDHYHDKERAIREVVRDYRHQLARDEAEEVMKSLKNEGHTVVGSGELSELHPKAKYIHDGTVETWHYDALKMDIAAHQTEECHVRVVSIGKEYQIQVEHACIKPDNHRVAGKSEVKNEGATSGGLSDDEKQERKAIREARKVFNGQVNELIVKPNKTQVRLVAVDVAVSQLKTHVAMGGAAKMLGLVPADGLDGFYKWPLTFTAWAEEQEPEAVLLALLFADAEGSLLRGGEHRTPSAVSAKAYADTQDTTLMDAKAMLKVLKKASKEAK